MGIAAVRAILPAFILVALAVGPAWADSDHDRARRAVQSGTVMPLEDILASARRQFGGQFLEAELEYEHDRPVYEIKLLTPEGRVVELYYDAADGTLLNQKEKRGRR